MKVGWGFLFPSLTGGLWPRQSHLILGLECCLTRERRSPRRPGVGVGVGGWSGCSHLGNGTHLVSSQSLLLSLSANSALATVIGDLWDLWDTEMMRACLLPLFQYMADL